MAPSLDPLFLLLGGGLAILALTLVYLSQNWKRDTKKQKRVSHTNNAVSLLFHGDALTDATDAAQDLIGDATDFDNVVRKLSPRFSGLAAVALTTPQTLKIGSDLPDDDAYLQLTANGDSLTLTLEDGNVGPADRHALLSERTRSAELVSVIERAPLAMWTTDANGDVLDKNSEYDQLCALSGLDIPIEAGDDTGFRARDKRRISVEQHRTNTLSWFDVTSRQGENGKTLNYAVNADAIVSAEAAQRNFVQTLTKTFAQLSIGLAIFNRQQQLALFNPALIDLTTLPADFLSSRPSLHSFFDQLREKQIMPEPRNYRNWRDQLSDMIAAAQDGQYCETWTLPSGLTYRIVGKPHPDGAVAFLVEDISAEISLTRRFRAELELSQAVLDSLPSAVAVFSRTGTLTFCNTRFRDLWKCSPDESFIEMTIVDITKVWQNACQPTDVWNALRSFIATVDERTEWRKPVTHENGETFDVHAIPLSGGATLVRFGEAVEASSTPSTSTTD